MIDIDQPIFFADDCLVRVSSKADGTMLDRSLGVHSPEIVSNREKLCDAMGISYGDAAYMRIVYTDAGTYKLTAEIDERSTTKHTSEVVADGLFTSEKGVAMMLPIADCVATVVHDPVKNYLALLHMGRHSTFAGLMEKALAQFKVKGSRMEELVVWMSPSAQKESYKLDYFDYKDDPLWKPFFVNHDNGFYIDMQGYNRARCIENGVLEKNIHVSQVDTYRSDDYFSHSAGDTTGRFVVVAMMR